MKVMIELETNDIKKILNFACDYVIENEGAIEKLETLLDALKSSAEEAKEADDAILNQIKSFVMDKSLGDYAKGREKPISTLLAMNSVIRDKGYITVWEFVEYLEGRTVADNLEASYELLNSYGWNRTFDIASDLFVKDGRFIINHNKVVRLD